jgi:Caspase domain
VRRRDFLTMSASVAGTLAVNSAFSQPITPPARAAVVIGINKTGDLPPLRAAASGAKSIASWLQSEGFETTLLVDEEKPVLASEIFNAISIFVRRGTLNQLIVYFSGHGFLTGPGSEFWLLSNAPENPNEAVSLLESAIRAKSCGIPNVVFISDACRSRADSLSALGVRGSLIFPNLNIARAGASVDKFLATLAGDPALELPVANSSSEFEGIYTSCFMDAFKRPDPNMIKHFPGGLDVIPNRLLEPYIEREVRTRVQAKSRTLRQIPDAEVNSPDTIYIGRVLAQPTLQNSVSTTGFGGLINESTVVDAVRFQLRLTRGLYERILPQERVNILKAAATSGLSSAQALIRNSISSLKSESMTGFTITGAQLRRVAAIGALAQIADLSDRTIVRVPLTDERPAISVALQFSQGAGTVLTALNGFVANVVVEDQKVVNVSYFPVEGGPRWSEYQSERVRLNELHAVVSSAARFGVFRIDGENINQQAADLGDTIRVLKDIDPTLGIYAAYAYSGADLLDKVRSVQAFMLADLRVDIFDVALLAGMLSELPYLGAGARSEVFPFCPMLAQGWALLRIKDVRLAPKIDALRDHLQPSLWTTFDESGMALVYDLIQTDSIK